MAHGFDGLTICQAAVAVAATGDEPKQKVTEARPLKKHHVNVNVQKTVQSWKCRMLTLSFMSFVFVKKMDNRAQ